MSICQEDPAKAKGTDGVGISIGVGSWARTPQELVHPYELAEKAIEYRYLLGGSLLIDMEEQQRRKKSFH